MASQQQQQRECKPSTEENVSPDVDYSVRLSTTKLPFIAMGLVNSAVAMLLNELAARFFELAFSELSCERTMNDLAPRSPKTSSGDSAQSDQKASSMSTDQAMMSSEVETEATHQSNENDVQPLLTVKEESSNDDKAQLPIYDGSSFPNFTLVPGVSEMSTSDVNRVTTLTYLKRYTCDIQGCGKIFFSRSSMLHHRQCHQVCQDFQCPQEGCNVTFSKQSDLRDHMFVHQASLNVNPSKCTFPGCQKTFLYQDRLIEHFRIHTGERPYACDFPGCHYRFARRSNLFAHKRVHVDKTQRRQYHCAHPGCGKTFLYIRSLTEHMNIHMGERPYRCDFPGCGKSFTSNSYLHAHRRVHANATTNVSSNFEQSTSNNLALFPVTVTVPVPNASNTQATLIPLSQLPQSSNSFPMYPFFPGPQQ